MSSSESSSVSTKSSGSSTSSTSNLGEEIYSGTVSFGRVMALISAVFVSIITVVMIVIGIVILVKKDPKKSVQGTVKSCGGFVDNNCCVSHGVNNDKFNCNIKVQYTVEGKKYLTPTLNIDSDVRYAPGSTITLYYDPKNPAGANLKKPPPKWLGGVLIGIALFICASAWVWVWLTRKYKVAAASQGIGTGLDIISGGRL